MAKQSRILPAQRRREEESLLIRSAESLGRMIGALQRQLEGAGKRLSLISEDVASTPVVGAAGGRKTKSGARSVGTRRQQTGAARKTVDKSQKTTRRTAKTSTTKKPADRSRSGARKKSARKNMRGG